MKILPLLICFVALSESSPASAHARWKSGSSLSPPRSLNDNLKTPPCGGTQKSGTRKQYKPGEKISLEFEETVNHPGYFEIHLLGKDDQPVQGVPRPLLKIEDTQNNRVVDGKAHQYQATLQVPAVNCSECAFQLIQVMLDDPANPSNYYSCTDISIGGAAPAKPTGLKVQKKR